MEPNIEWLFCGGNACTFLITTPENTTHVARLTEEAPPSNEREIKMQQKLFDKFSPFVVEILSTEVIENKIPDEYLLLMRKHHTSKVLLAEWAKEDVAKWRLTRMAYAAHGSLSKYQYMRNPDDIRSICFQLLLFLYCAQAEYGFAHNDLTSNNIVIADWKNGSMVAQVIDFDYVTFNAFSNKIDTANNLVGSRYVMPPEVLRSPGTPTYLGAIDLWSLGVTMLGCLFGETFFLHDDNDDEILLRIDCLQSYLGNTNEPPPPLKNFSMIRYKVIIDKFDPVTLGFYASLLHPDPFQRILRGDVYKYLKEGAYFAPIKGKDVMLERFVKKLSDGKPVNILKSTKAQLNRALKAGLIEGGIHCTHCKSKEGPFFMCAEYGFIVCGHECRSERLTH